MKSVWVAGYANKEDREKEILSYRNAYEELTEVLVKHFRKKEAVRDYSDPNWMASQIAVNEYNKVIGDVLSLIDLSKE